MLKSTPYREEPAEEPILPVEKSRVILELEKVQASARAVHQILTTLHEQNVTESSQIPDDSINESSAIAANRQRLKEILLKESLVDQKIIAEIQKIFGKDSEIYKQMLQAKAAEISEGMIEYVLDNITIYSLGLTTRGQILKVAGKQTMVNPDNTDYIMDFLSRKEINLSDEIFSKKILAIVGATISVILLHSLNRHNIDEEYFKSRLDFIIYWCLPFCSVVLSGAIAGWKTESLEEKSRNLRSVIRKLLSLGKNILTDAQFTQLKSEIRIKLNEWEKFIAADQKVKKPNENEQLTQDLAQDLLGITKRLAVTQKLRVSPIMEEFETPADPARVGQPTGIETPAEATAAEEEALSLEQPVQVLKR